MPAPFDWTHDELARLEREGLRRSLVTRTSPQLASRIASSRGTLLNFGSNDYLALAADERLREAARRAIDEVGVGSGASPLVTGFGRYHAMLAERLAQFEHAERALLLVSGYAANVAVVTALVGRGDLILSDARNHASIIDGCRLAGAEIAIYRHGDVEHARELLVSRSGVRRKLIITDSLFSMDGDIAPLESLADLAEEYGAMLVVDEAHATGVFGARGSGVVEALGLESRIAVRVGTLSKALGSSGGFIVGPASVIDLLMSTARTFIFSTAGTEAAAAAALKALEIVEQEPAFRASLLAMSQTFRAELRSRGFQVQCSAPATGSQKIPLPDASQIIPIVLGDPLRTMQVAQQLRERGIWVPGIRPPSVPQGQSLLRISLTSAHTSSDLDQLLSELLALLPAASRENSRS